MEKVNAKEIIFRIGEVGNSEVVGWLPYSKAIKMIILDYISSQRKRPWGTATTTTEIFTILADWDSFYREKNQLDSEGYFFKTHKELFEEWGVKEDVVNTSVKFLIEMGWVNKKNENMFINGHPQTTPYYRINYEKIIEDIQTKYPPLQKLF